MAEFVLKNIKLCLNGIDLSSYTNQADLMHEAEMLDATTFADNSDRTYLAGLRTHTASYNGFMDIETVDATMNPLVGASGLSVVSFGVENGAAENTVGYSMQGRVSNIQRFGSVGEIAPYTIDFQGHDFLGRGIVGYNGTTTSTDTGTGYQLGAVSATQTLYSAVHVLAASGTTPTLDVTIESDDNSGFTSATTRITHTQFTDSVGHELSSVAGAITDDYWRAVLTIGGTSPSYTVFIVLAIV